MNQSKLITLYILLAAALVFSGCRMAEDPTPTPNPVEQAELAEQRLELIGTFWEADYFGEADQPLPVMEDSKLTLNMMVERYAGFSGCNWFLGVYFVDGEELRFYTPAQTAFLCEETSIEAQAATYMSSLVNVTRYAMSEEALDTWTVDDQKMVTFTSAVPAPLEGTSWTAKLVFDGEQMRQSSSWDMSVSAVFADGIVSGNGGCNDYTADYIVDGNVMSISNLEHAGAICEEPSGANDIEDLYFAALENTLRYDSLVASLLLSGEGLQEQVLFGTP